MNNTIMVKRGRPVGSIDEAKRQFWNSWDWTLQDAELARQNNITRERARQIRRLLGKPNAFNHHNSLATQERDSIIEKNKKRYANMTVKEVAKELGTSHPNAYVIKRRYGFKTKNVQGQHIVKFDWDIINLRVSPTILSKIWGSTRQYFSSQRYVRRSPALLKGKILQREIENQKLLAREWFKKRNVNA